MRVLSQREQHERERLIAPQRRMALWRGIAFVTAFVVMTLGLLLGRMLR